ncbi:MAG: hypothetical protein KIS76_07670 [Pyrinomonadaceae bacterium]|nr:hypothetical protein [Pyrinomonadaceae bacterium]
MFATVLSVAVLAFLSVSCTSKKTELPGLVPKETLVYLETKDLGELLRTMTQSPRFKEIAAGTHDFSALDETPAAVAITGFETSEQQLTDENSSLNFKPRFAALIESGLWNWQTRGFVEEVLGDFVNETYGGEVVLETTEKFGGTWYEWKSRDGKSAFALVQNSLIFFGNDAASIEKCLAAARGETEKITADTKFTNAREDSKELVAFGYVSPDGVGQLANIAGVFAAVAATEEEAGRNFVSGFLPRLLRNTVSEVVWTARRNRERIEDSYSFALPAKISEIFQETLQVSEKESSNLFEYVPADVESLTKYDLKEPLIAWRSAVLVAQDSAGAANPAIFAEFSKNLLNSYGISDAELFLRSVDSQLITVQITGDSDRVLTIASVKDFENLKRSLNESIDLRTRAETIGGAEVWRSKDGFAAAFHGNILILGDFESVQRSLDTKAGGKKFSSDASYQYFSQKRAIATTFGTDLSSAEKIVRVLGTVKDDAVGGKSNFVVRTEIKDKRLVRTTISDFGLIGSMIAQFDQ